MTKYIFLPETYNASIFLSLNSRCKWFEQIKSLEILDIILLHTSISLKIASLNLSSCASRHFVKILVDQPFVILMQDLDAEM